MLDTCRTGDHCSGCEIEKKAGFNDSYNMAKGFLKSLGIADPFWEAAIQDYIGVIGNEGVLACHTLLYLGSQSF